MTNMHPLVVAEIASSHARVAVELEKLRSQRASATNHARIMSLHKKIKEAERVLSSWQIVIGLIREELNDDEEPPGVPQ